MLRFLLNIILALLALRIVVSITRMLTSGRRPEPRIDEEPRTRVRDPRPQSGRADAIDVPYTELPPDAPTSTEKSDKP